MTTETLTHGRVTWINIVKATREDLAGLQAVYPKIHPLNVRDCQHSLEYPKLDHHDDYLFLVMHFPIFQRAQRLSEANEVDIFVARGLLITVHTGDLKPLVEFFDGCKRDAARRAEVMGRGASPLLYHVLHELIDYCFPILRKVDANIRTIENDLFCSRTRHIIAEMAVVRRDVIALRRIIHPQLNVLQALEQGSWPWIHEELDLYWSDLQDHLRQLVEALEEDIQLIQGLAETIDTLASHRIDEVVRVLTFITMITLPTTVLSTIYSMNVPMPGGEHPLTFYIVLVLGIILPALVFWFLKRRDWL